MLNFAMLALLYVLLFSIGTASFFVVFVNFFKLINGVMPKFDHLVRVLPFLLFVPGRLTEEGKRSLPLVVVGSIVFWLSFSRLCSWTPTWTHESVEFF